MVNGKRKVYYPKGKPGELKGIQPLDMVVQDDGQVQVVGYDMHLYAVKAEG